MARSEGYLGSKIDQKTHPRNQNQVHRAAPSFLAGETVGFCADAHAGPSRLMCSDETSARVNGRNQWAWVFQNAEVCLHVIRPSRGHGGIQEGLGEHRPVGWVADLSSAQKHHPAEQWQVW